MIMKVQLSESTPATGPSSARKLVKGLAAVAAAAATLSLSAAITGATDAATAATPPVTTGSVIASDSMTRTVASGLGTADVGGVYQVPAMAGVSVGNGVASVASLAPKASLSAYLPGAQALNVRAQTTFTLPVLPSAGTGVYAGVVLREQANGDGYRVRVRVQPGGTAFLQTSVVSAGKETLIASMPLTEKVTPGRAFVVDGSVLATSPVTIESRAYWADGPRPDWQQTLHPAAAAQVSTPGAVGFWAYTAGDTPALGFTVDNVGAWNLGSVTPPVRTDAGVPAGAVLTKHVGDITITTDGTVLDHMDIAGFVIVKAANVRITNSIVRGSSGGTGDTALINSNDKAVKNLLVQDTTLVPATPSYWLDGMIGHDYTANRVETYNVVDGFGVYNNTGTKQYDNVTIENSYIHDLTWYNVDKDHTNGTHNDGIQVQGGANITIINNTIECFRSTTAGDQNWPYPQAPGSGILLQNNVAPVTGVDIENNVVDGSMMAIHVFANVGTASVGTIAGNRLGRNERDFGNASTYQVRIESQATKFNNPLTSNVWDDTGLPLAVGRNLGIRYDN